ncbi:MAG: tetratricopeptide repeat protein [Ignavibacteriales bacterium]|nr:tetratricopeptide repeat protein [Ignavibacteriales bacterium]
MKIISHIILTAFILLSPIASRAQSIEYGKNLFEQKKYTEAKNVFEKLIQENDENAEANYYLGLVFLVGERNYDEEVDFLEAAVELNEKNARYHYQLGAAYGSKARESGIFKQMFLAPKVQSEFERAVELDKTYIEARLGLMQYYLLAPGIMGGSVGKAKAQADTLFQLSHFQGNLAFAVISEYEKNVPAAEEFYKRAIAYDVKEGKGYNALGYFYLRNKRFDEAIAQFKKYVEVEPGKANSFDSLGDGYLGNENYDDAMKQYEKALERDPKFSSSVFGLAKCFEKKGLVKEAKQMYERYLTLETKGKRADEAKEKVKN